MLDRRPVILDVDTGIDDSLALLYAVASPEADVVAVTCLSGNVEAEQVGINTRAILELAGRPDIEVAMGRPVPLVRPLETTPETHGPRGLGYAELAPPTTPLSDRHAVDLLVDEARRRPGELTLVSLGPLTNVALAVEREPDAATAAAWLRADGRGVRGRREHDADQRMERPLRPRGGEDRVRGVERGHRGRFGTARPLALGLNVTERARITTDAIVRLARRAGSRPDDSVALARGEDPMLPVHSVASDPIVRYLADALRFYFEFHDRYDGFYGAFIHDPLAVAAALDRSLVEATPLFVDVETRGELTTGMTVADTRHHTGRAPNADVVMEADIATFLDRLVERIGGLAADRSAMAR